MQNKADHDDSLGSHETDHEGYADPDEIVDTNDETDVERAKEDPEPVGQQKENIDHACDVTDRHIHFGWGGNGADQELFHAFYHDLLTSHVKCQWGVS